MTRVRLFIALALSIGALAALGASSSIGADESSLPPAQILADVDAAMANVHTLHFSAHAVANSTVTITGDVSSTSLVDVTFKFGSQQRAHIRGIRSKLYYRANTSFWRHGAGVKKDLAGQLADRWVKVPGSSNATAFIRALVPKNFIRCATNVGGTATTGPPETVAGVAALVLIEAGDQPGTAPGKVYVAAQGPPLLLRVVQTGPKSAGGPHDTLCDDDDDTTKTADVTVSAYDKPVHIATPPHALDPRKLNKKKGLKAL